MRQSTLTLALLVWISVYPFEHSIHPVSLDLDEENGCEYWVAPPPSGNDNNSGSISSPWATLVHASENVPDNHCTVWFNDGEYVGENRLHRRFSTPTFFIAIHPYRAVLKYNGAVVSISGGKNITLDGFVFSHTGPGADVLVVQVDRDDQNWAEWITLRNNIFHDSYNNDLLKIYNGARFVTVESNIFYNQGVAEQHIDVNSVTDVAIQDNIFFNDFAGSGRINRNDTKHYIVIKDSNENSDGLEGSERVTVQRNIFLNWEGGDGETFVQVGNDGKPYYEAKDVWIKNNLFIGNSPNQIGAAFGVSGARDVWFANNTIVGDLPSLAYAFRIGIKASNPANQNIFFYNNIWSDPTGTMGADLSGSANEFSDGNPSETENLILDNNLYWNGIQGIPSGDLVSPLIVDARRIVADPLVTKDQSSIILPRWTGQSFLSGSKTIRQEFIRLVEQCGKIPSISMAVGKADLAFAPSDDILNHPRTATPDLGAYEYQPILLGFSTLTSISLGWSAPREPDAASLMIAYSDGQTERTITGTSPSVSFYTLNGLKPYTIYQITLMVLDLHGTTLAQSNTITLMTTNLKTYLPLISDGGVLSNHDRC